MVSSARRKSRSGFSPVRSSGTSRSSASRSAAALPDACAAEGSSVIGVTSGGEESADEPNSPDNPDGCVCVGETVIGSGVGSRVGSMSAGTGEDSDVTEDSESVAGAVVGVSVAAGSDDDINAESERRSTVVVVGASSMTCSMTALVPLLTEIEGAMVISTDGGGSDSSSRTLISGVVGVGFETGSTLI